MAGRHAEPSELARLRIEAEAVARLRHPNIVQIYEVGEHEVDAGIPRPYFTLEYASGGNLARRLGGLWMQTTGVTLLMVKRCSLACTDGYSG